MRPIGIDGRWFKELDSGRTCQFRGINLSGASKLPAHPPQPSHDNSLFQHHRTVSFTDRPFPLNEAHEHFERLSLWGFNLLRFCITWEAIEHEGPGKYDDAYLDYVVEVLTLAGTYGFRVIIDPHQDVWSRFTGGSGAPGWTVALAGFVMDGHVLRDTGAAYLHGFYTPDVGPRPNAKPSDGDPYPNMFWPTNYNKLAASTLFTLFFAGHDAAPRLRVDAGHEPGGRADESLQSYLQRHFCHAMQHLWQRLHRAGLTTARRGAHVGRGVVLGYDTFNEPSAGYIGMDNVSCDVTLRDLKQGLTPTPFEGMQLGAGVSVPVQRWYMSWRGEAKTGRPVLVNTKGMSAWRHDHNEACDDLPRTYLLPIQGHAHRDQDDSNPCLWARHGIWRKGTEKEDSCVLLKPHYFQRILAEPMQEKPVVASNDTISYEAPTCRSPHYRLIREATTGRVVAVAERPTSHTPIHTVKADFLRDYWVPFVDRFTHAIRSVDPTALCFFEPAVMAPPPAYPAHPRPAEPTPSQQLVYAPHWYDGLTLTFAHFSTRFTFDAMGYQRGHYTTRLSAVYLGLQGIHRCFSRQMDLLRREGLARLGETPLVIGEIGIPFQMDNKASYRARPRLDPDPTGAGSPLAARWHSLRRDDAHRYAAQNAALAASLAPTDHPTPLTTCLWHYHPAATYARGDAWQGEDLSVYGADDARAWRAAWRGGADGEVGRASARAAWLARYVGATCGGRALHAMLRPCACRVPGRPVSQGFRWAMGGAGAVYRFTYAPFEARAGEGEGAVLALFLPAFHFDAPGDTAPRLDVACHAHPPQPPDARQNVGPPPHATRRPVHAAYRAPPGDGLTQVMDVRPPGDVPVGWHLTLTVTAPPPPPQAPHRACVVQ